MLIIFFIISSNILSNLGSLFFPKLFHLPLLANFICICIYKNLIDQNARLENKYVYICFIIYKMLNNLSPFFLNYFFLSVIIKSLLSNFVFTCIYWNLIDQNTNLEIKKIQKHASLVSHNQMWCAKLIFFIIIIIYLKIIGIYITLEQHEKKNMLIITKLLSL